MASSWINAAEQLGFSLALACPDGYDPAVGFTSPKISITRDPREAVRHADVVSTDVWASMGQESEIETRSKVFKDFQVNFELLRYAGKNAFVLHCLPAHRGEEITEEVMESQQSLVWEEAENRLHVQKAILERLCGSAWSTARLQEKMCDRQESK
jgi:ornithine carbamoyltransferase